MDQMKRIQLVVYKKLQLGMVMRLFTYWTAIWLVVFCVPIIVRSVVSEMTFAQLAKSLLADFWFPMLISAMVMPLVVFDYMRFSNRFAGPVGKLSRAIGDLADDKQVDPITFRKDDFLRELASDFNRLLARLQSQPESEQRR